MRAHGNFIAGRLERRRREERVAKGCLLLAVASGLVPMILVGLLLQMSTERAKLLADINRQRERSLRNIVQSAWMEGENQRLEPGHKVVVAAHTNLARWSALLKEVRDRLPEGLWLTQVGAARPDYDPTKPASGGSAPQVVVISGSAAKAAAVGAYLEQLNRSPMFAKASLTRSHPSEARVPGAAAGTSVPAVDFELRAELKQPIAEGQP